ncbi:uracil-DNA glycosylase [Paracoccus sp. PS-1]|uniref:uracil-DNA glycosylase n=1 Tax=Paracoccus sp. PS1 TaxID=2963938 RepID=UPI0027E4050B|nr:uracil-DNA glycosylase [Paracoccus sp. PS1]MDQ7263900.1 uracil-DNA glycosylase [Paracoccus sp. PS1]
MSAKDILSALGRLDFENTFNPYFDRCSVHDAAEAPELRSYYLVEMLERAALSDLDAIWVGRDLGYRGGRRTGLALTDDIHFSDHLVRWGLEPKRPTSGAPVPERTAAAIWDILMRVKVPVFLWNVFPLHPYEGGDPFSNRAHNARERKAGTDILISIVRYLKPQRLVAVGNDAFNVLSNALPDEKVFKVRHPSYGGQNEFLQTMRDLYADILIETEPDLFSASIFNDQLERGGSELA